MCKKMNETNLKSYEHILNYSAHKNFTLRFNAIKIYPYSVPSLLSTMRLLLT